MNTASISDMRSLQAQPQQQLAPQPDQRVDMFSERGFKLAQRLAQAYSTSNAIPVAFRAYVEKKDRNGNITYVENQAALGNCLVAIEVAQAVPMSIAAVMQNADVIEGKLRWSGKFVIAAINASGRFTPLRFDSKNKGVIKASYKEKQGWNNELRRFDFKTVEVEVENIECIAWALPAGMAFPAGVYTLDQARAARLPVIESAPVSMKLVVEEGWYGKSGSKWQTEMKHLMFQYRAGTFFGNIHAPDIVMGMGQTSEEARDITTVEVAADGQVTSVTTEELRRPAGETPPEATVVSQVNTNESAEDPATDEQADHTQETGPTTAGEPALTFAEVADALAKAKSAEEIAAARGLIPRVVDAMQQAELNAIADRGPAAAPASRRTSRAASNNSME